MFHCSKTSSSLYTILCPFLTLLPCLLRRRFFDTILLLHKWKSANYKAADPTRTAVFFRNAYQTIVAMMPFYFDRIQAFAGTLYGFDVRQLAQGADAKAPSKDWNADVLEFLRRQEKGGGPSTAVAVVLDAARTNNIHFERGMQFSAPLVNEEEQKRELQDLRLCWPAVYVRSTLYLGSMTARGHLRSERDSGTASNASSSTNMLPTWRKSEHHSPSTASLTNRKTPTESLQSQTLMEYDGSWPHSEWEKLIALISPDTMAATMANLNRINLETMPESGNTGSDQGAVSYRVEMEESRLARLEHSMAEGAASLFDVGKSPKSSLMRISDAEPANTIATSTFHIAPLSDFIHLVVIVKGDEENRWHRRRTPLTDQEIRAFLDSMASKLRVSGQFSSHSIPKKSQVQVRLAAFQSISFSTANGLSELWSDDSLEALLKAVKNEFGLRPTQEGGTILSRNSPSRRGLRFSPGRLSLSSTHERASTSALSMSVEKSAAVFFMGSELASVVDE